MAESAEDLKKQLQELNDKLKESGGLGIDLNAAFNEAGNSTIKLKKYIEEVKKRLDDVIDSSDYIYRTFQDISSELSGQNALLTVGKSSFKSLTSIAQDLNFYQKGNTELSEKQLKKIQDKIKLDKSELEFVAKNLQLSVDNNKKTAENLQTRKAGGEKLSKTQEAFLKNYQKESDLLNNTKKTLESGIIPNLERELKLSKQISEVRRDIGGLAGNAAKLISAYGGPLSSLLNINKASEAIDEFAKKQIEKALKSKDVQEKLLKIEQDKAELLRKEIEAIDEINKKTNLSEDEKKIEIAEIEKKTREGINKEEEKANKVKEKAVKSADSLINRFRALGIVVKELGVGLLKAFTDPVSILGFIIKLFKFIIDAGFEVNTRVTAIGRSLGISAGLAGRLSSQMIGAAKAAGGIFINSTNAQEAIGELADNLGIAVGFSGEQIALQVKLTKLLGLSADEAAKFNKISALSGQSSSTFVKNVQKGAFASMQANKIHLSDKQVLQDVAKLSAGILVKFQGNPEALGKAVVQAKKLGISLEKLEGISDSLLDFQSSIESELQAELLTGRQLNLEKARQAALTGNQADLMKEIAEQAGSAKDFTKMNVLAQKSLAQAFGMSREEMAEMLLQQEMVNEHGDKAAELNAQQLQDFKKSGLSLDQYLDKQKNQLSLQEQTNATLERFRETMVNVVAPLGQALIGAFLKFTPILQKIVEDQLPKIKPVIDDIIKRIDNIDFNQLREDIKNFGDKLENIKKTLEEYKPVIIGIGVAIASIFVINKIGKFFSFLSAGFSNIKGLVTGLGKGIGSAFSGVKSLFSPKVPTPAPDTVTPSPSPAPTPADTRSSRGRRGKRRSPFSKPRGVDAADDISSKTKPSGGDDGSKFRDKMKNIAEGIKAFGNGKVILGGLVGLPASAVGLIAMIPGVIGIKLIEKVNGPKFQEAMEGVSKGIEAFGKGKITGGAANLVVSSVGLIAMIPGVIGAKLIEKINGSKFQEAMYGLAYGIEAFGKGKITGGAANLILSAVGLIAMLPGAAAAKGIEAMNVGPKFKRSMKSIASGINTFGKKLSLGSIAKMAAAIALLGLSLLPAAYAFNKFAEVKWEDMAKAGVALIGLSLAGKVIGSSATSMIKGALAIALLGASLIPAAYALQMFTEISWEDLGKAGVALIGLGVAGAAFGTFLPLMLMGALAIAALGVALIPFAYALNLMSPALEKFTPLIEAFGNVISKVFSGIAEVVTSVFKGIQGVITAIGDSISNVFASLEKADGEKLLAVGGGLTAVGVGLAALGAGKVIDAIGSFFSADPIAKIERIAAAGAGLQSAANGFKVISGGLTQFSAAISSINTSKLDAVSSAIIRIKDALSSLTKGGGLAESISSFFSGGGALGKLEKLAALGDKLKVTADAVQRINGVSTPTAAKPPAATPTEIKSNKETINVAKVNSSSSDKLLADVIFELKETRKELKAQLSKPPAPIILTMDGKKMATQLASYPELQKGLGKNMVKMN